VNVNDEIVDVDFGVHDSLQVLKAEDDKYHVVVAGVVRHPNCSAEDAMRALGHYIHELSYRLQSSKRQVHESGPVQ